MLIIDKYKPTLKFNLENGIYMLGMDSATGKTRLCKIMKTLAAYHIPINAYTYEDWLKNIPINSVLNKQYQVVLLDRYDMYEGAGKELIESLKNNLIILIDCKDKFTPNIDFDSCRIFMESDKIEVRL